MSHDDMSEAPYQCALESNALNTYAKCPKCAPGSRAGPRARRGRRHQQCAMEGRAAVAAVAAVRHGGPGGSSGCSSSAAVQRTVAALQHAHCPPIRTCSGVDTATGTLRVWPSRVTEAAPGKSACSAAACCCCCCCCRAVGLLLPLLPVACSADSSTATVWLTAM